ncbi:UNVERIFIED_CONTAM: hypothetical protein FKN15_072282 [Acipenser sinensis]
MLLTESKSSKPGSSSSQFILGLDFLQQTRGRLDLAKRMVTFGADLPLLLDEPATPPSTTAFVGTLVHASPFKGSCKWCQPGLKQRRKAKAAAPAITASLPYPSKVLATAHPFKGSCKWRTPRASPQQSTRAATAARHHPLDPRKCQPFQGLLQRVSGPKMGDGLGWSNIGLTPGTPHPVENHHADYPCSDVRWLGRSYKKCRGSYWQ